MLTKQARQFEQWADDRERLMAIKAKRAAEKQSQTKKDGAMALTFMGIILVLIACFGFIDTQDSDYVVVLVFGTLVSAFGFIGLKE